MNRLYIIVGAGDMSDSAIYAPDGAYIIAADGGLRHVKAAGLTANLVLGDFDSLGGMPTGEKIKSVPAEKDDTDTMLAVREALTAGAEEIAIYGGLGGRFDHSFANLQALKFISDSGARGYLVGGGFICTVIKNSAISFEAGMSGYVSVFSFGDRAEGVNLRGLRYPLFDAVMTDSYPLGVSNEFTGIDASISV
ncbi:MAG: thiamine diphosphokinase, partial [Clostridia bacterium]|nr:thiamine diphosphokinase [Clostridia bacterium]